MEETKNPYIFNVSKINKWGLVGPTQHGKYFTVWWLGGWPGGRVAGICKTITNSASAKAGVEARLSLAIVYNASNLFVCLTETRYPEMLVGG